MNLALLLGLYAYLTGRQGTVWNATPRRVQPEMQIEHVPLMDGSGLEAGNAPAQRSAA
jgi:hypothetical protein